MDAQENFEMNISALIDGELEPEALLPTLDFLASNQDAQTFYLESRQLQAQYGAGNFPLGESKPSKKLWGMIEKKSGLRRPAIFKLLSPSPAWAAAAAVFLIIGLWTGGWIQDIGSSNEKAPNSELTLEANKGSMDEDRFVQLTSEILRSDRRYHRKMLEIMEAVNSRSFVREGSSEGESRREGRQIGSEDIAQANTTPRQSTGQSNSPVSLRFW